jgi:DNA-binding NarL/FixJ family response regulator
MNDPMGRVVIADDHHVVRQGLRALIEQFGDMSVVGEASDGLEAIELVKDLSPDVIVMDLAMPRLGGSQATARIQEMDVATRVLVLSMYADLTLVQDALRHGARGYLLKNCVQEELHLALQAAMQGQVYLSPVISRELVEHFLAMKPQEKDLSLADRLTAREREVLQLVVEGHTNASISHILTISPRTVEKHRANLMEKLAVHDLAGLISMAIRHDLVILPDYPT